MKAGVPWCRPPGREIFGRLHKDRGTCAQCGRDRPAQSRLSPYCSMICVELARQKTGRALNGRPIVFKA